MANLGASAAAVQSDHIALVKLLAKVEILDCKCPRIPVPCRHKRQGEVCDCPDYFPPCRHILAAAQHQLSTDEWRQLLQHAFPRNYDHARPHDRFSKVLIVKARVALLTRRRRLGLSLWNHDDWWERFPEDIEKSTITRDGKRLLNGADDKNQIVKARQSCQPPPPRERA